MATSERLIKIYQNIKILLEFNNFNITDYKDISYGIQFSVSFSNWSGIIRIYQNKNGVIRNDYSQLKNGEYASKVRAIIEQKEIPIDIENSTLGLRLPIIGTDESGKGDYFGPLVSAGVYVDENTALLLEFEGVRDSKKLSDNKIEELAKKIVEICKGNYSVIEISPEKYNDLYEKFIKEKKNLNTLLAWGHAKTIEELLLKVECNTAIADQFADERFIQSKLQEKGKKLKLVQMPKAEQNIAVAAASILARARFLEKLRKLSDDYKIDLPKGVSQSVIDNARKFVKTYGEDDLKKVAKLHFRTTKEVLKN
ncbi:MAG: ribonuclease HIII [Nitrospirota bacterium]